MKSLCNFNYHSQRIYVQVYLSDFNICTYVSMYAYTYIYIQKMLSVLYNVGFVCSLDHLKPSGCCDNLSTNSKRFYCLNCLPVGCCSLYEICVSCCLDPNKVSCIVMQMAVYLLLHFYCTSFSK